MKLHWDFNSQACVPEAFDTLIKNWIRICDLTIWVVRNWQGVMIFSYNNGYVNFKVTVLFQKLNVRSSLRKHLDEIQKCIWKDMHAVQPVIHPGKSCRELQPPNWERPTFQLLCLHLHADFTGRELLPGFWNTTFFFALDSKENCFSY